MGRLLYNVNFWLEYLTKSFDRSMPTNKQAGETAEDVNYYCKINEPFILEGGSTLNELNLFKNSGYSYDLYRILYPFKNNLKFRHIFGDVTKVPRSPTFVKSRPICKDNQNAVLLPLDSNRHYKFVEDKKSFLSKKNKIVWRGAAYQKHRLEFLESCSRLPFLDAGNTSNSKEQKLKYVKKKMSIKEQLDSKFVISLEGNDVATSLKWIMSSNSVCIMPKPKFETWFMEGILQPNIHYVQIKDDYSNLEEQFLKYLNAPDECLKIISNANIHADKYRSKHTRLMLARMVCSKLFNLTDV